MNYPVKTMPSPWPQIDWCIRSVMTVLYVGTKKNVYLAAGAVVTIFTAGLLTGHFGIKSSGNVDVETVSSR